MPNTLAYLVLLFWPVVIVGLFLTRPLREAVIWSILLSYLLLPQGTSVDLPGLPGFDRGSVPVLTILVCLLFLSRQKTRLVPESWTARVLVLAVFFGALASVVLNRDPLTFGIVTLPGLTLYDWVSVSFDTVITLVPFLLGRALLAEPEGQRAFLRALLLAGLAYSIPMLAEIRLSPQLHNWVYGFFQHQFAQQVRFDGFRPMVFLSHGLSVAMFATMALAAAAILWRAERTRALAEGRPSRRFRLLAATLYLGGVLVLCKTVSALFFALLILPLILFTGVRVQVAAAVAFALAVLAYPEMRAAEIVPERTILAVAEQVHPARAASLEFRFEHERRLIEHASRRPVFGWGPSGRNRVFDEDTGRDISITDGLWISLFGTYGWVGFFSRFGLLVLPIVAIARLAGRARPPVETAGLCLILAIDLMNLIPNATITPITWLVAGALLGHAERTRASLRAARGAERQRLRAARTAPGARPGRGVPPPDLPPADLPAAAPSAADQAGADGTRAGRPRGGGAPAAPLRPRPARGPAGAGTRGAPAGPRTGRG